MAFRINVGKRYNDFKSLECDLKKFEEENNVNLSNIVTVTPLHKKKLMVNAYNTRTI